MSRSRAPLQINGFEGGLNTEFNPLEVPPNISSDEVNMELDRDKSRRKRLGFNYETSANQIDTGIALDESKYLARKLFRWENAGGNPEQTILVVQVGNHLGFYDVNANGAASDNSIYEEELDSQSYESQCSFAVVDGILVVAAGKRTLSIYEYDDGSITSTTDTLKIRDLFGVEDTGNPSLTVQENINLRPESLPNSHRYNLRNQTFALPRPYGGSETLDCPIWRFQDQTDGIFPSNADSVNRHFYEDANDEDNRTLKRFFPEDMEKNAPGISRAPMGYFVIDALRRGNSRELRVDDLYDRYPELDYSISDLPRDETPGGATVLSEFAGRVWYAGFSGELIGGDLKSPRMSSYVLFSVLINDRTDITQCYQRADPTSPEDSALVDTDGGFIRVDGAYGINQLVPIANSLFVFAENGVWRISGGSGSAFSATSYEVEKVTDKGCFSPGSVILVEKSLFYWGRDAIYALGQNEFGVWETENVTQKTIQSLYLDIDFNRKQYCTGFFDGYERKIRWVYTGEPDADIQSEELVFHLDFACFTKNTIPTVSNDLPLVIAVGETDPYEVDSVAYNVVVNGVDVTVNSENVTIIEETQVPGLRQVIYLVVSELSPRIKYSFGYYNNNSFYDWGDEEIGYDAYLVTGFVTGGEARFKKQSRYLNAFFRKTEDGFDADLNPTNSSSCLLSSRMNWTNSNNSNKWSTPRQAYRIGKLYFPTGPSDPYDDGNTIISTRNKIRGIGHSIAFKFESEPGKNMHIHGWAWDLQSNDRE